MYCALCDSHCPVLVCIPCNHAFCSKCMSPRSECHICNEDPYEIEADIHAWPKLEK